VGKNTPGRFHKKRVLRLSVRYITEDEGRKNRRVAPGVVGKSKGFFSPLPGPVWGLAEGAPTYDGGGGWERGNGGGGQR